MKSQKKPFAVEIRKRRSRAKDAGKRTLSKLLGKLRPGIAVPITRS